MNESKKVGSILREMLRLRVKCVDFGAYFVIQS